MLIALLSGTRHVGNATYGGSRYLIWRSPVRCRHLQPDPQVHPHRIDLANLMDVEPDGCAGQARA